MMINNCGPEISLADIVNLEAELETKLPSDYQDFLFLYNGGTPTPDIIDVPDAPGTPTDVQVFFGIGRPVKSSDLSWNLSLIRGRCPGQNILPIACDSGGNLFCLKIEPGAVTEVVFCDLDKLDIRFYVVASNFSDFVAKLRPFHH